MVKEAFHNAIHETTVGGQVVNMIRYEGKINKRKEKNTVARRFGGWEGLCFSEEGG